MKPDNWDTMPRKTKAALAEELLNSSRGHFLISQALVRAIAVMKEDKPYPETSNIEDMEMLLSIFPIYAAINGLMLGK